MLQPALQGHEAGRRQSRDRHREAAEEPALLREAPHHRPVGRLDEVKAAKRAIVRYGFEEHPDWSAEPAEAEPRQLEAQKGA